MTERAVIAEVEDSNPQSATLFKRKSFTCAGGCENHRTLVAVFYTPIVLLFGGLLALATFPEITEYVAPWIGDPVSQHDCPSVGPTSKCLNQT